MFLTKERKKNRSHPPVYSKYTRSYACTIIITIIITIIVTITNYYHNSNNNNNNSMYYYYYNDSHSVLAPSPSPACRRVFAAAPERALERHQ